MQNSHDMFARGFSLDKTFVVSASSKFNQKFPTYARCSLSLRLVINIIARLRQIFSWLSALLG